MAEMVDRVATLASAMRERGVEGELAFVDLVCNGCGRRVRVEPPYVKPPGWRLGESWSDEDFCPGCLS